MALEREMILDGEIESISGFSGKKKRCPECSREVDDGFCAVHAEVEPEEDFSMTVKVDGTKVRLSEEDFEKVTGFSAQDIDALPENEKMVLLRKKLEGMNVRITGSKGKKHFYPNEIDILEE